MGQMAKMVIKCNDLAKNRPFFYNLNIDTDEI